MHVSCLSPDYHVSNLNSLVESGPTCNHNKLSAQLANQTTAQSCTARADHDNYIIDACVSQGNFWGLHYLSI